MTKPPILMLAALWCLPALTAQQVGKIVRPEDHSVLPTGEISIAAAAPGGKLELDGETIAAAEPFPNVYEAKISPAAGEHTLALVWDGGRQEIRFFVGEDAPPKFKPFQPHPPASVECAGCHGVSRRGRFRFTGGCFNCHEQEGFPKTHSHPPHILEQCGMCHNAHGSTAKAHLIVSRENACKLCHN